MIRHIVLLDARRGIAKAGDQPVHLDKDQAYFRDMTLTHGANVLMGRKTYDVIGALKDRHNYVATRESTPIDGVTLVPEIATFLQFCEKDIWVIGGAGIYGETIGMADELYVTEITVDLGCDQSYPEYQADFELVSRSEPQTEQGLPYTFCIYKKRTNR